MGHKPVGDTTTRSTSTSSAATGALAHKTGSLRVACVSADSFVAIGTNPTATAANGYYVHSGSAGIIALGAPGSNQVTGVSTTTATAGQQGADSGYITIIDFPEGTGSPFEVGDAVTLTVTNAGGGDQSYYDFSHKCVAYVDTSMGPNGYYVHSGSAGIIALGAPGSNQVTGISLLLQQPVKRVLIVDILPLLIFQKVQVLLLK